MAVLGLDIGGANLKAATPDKRAVSVPFALWKQPDRLPASLAELVAKFPDADEFAVTMTGELCDCYETKRQGVNAILDAVEHAAAGRPVRVWGTGGEFLDVPTARRNHLTVAAANWHALATFVGRFVPTHLSLLIDIGSTTTDLIPISYGIPTPAGLTDFDRLASGELLYRGVRRTPLCVFSGGRVAAEFFATTEDVYVVLGDLPENPADADTADGRHVTRRNCLARLARMLGGDLETLPEGRITEYAREVRRDHLESLVWGFRTVISDGAWAGSRVGEFRFVIASGSGEFLARQFWDRTGHYLGQDPPPGFRQLSDELGPAVSACAPAYAVAVLAAERRP
jgi:probable H4MPT-linked C1 transfer pathway protein